MKWNRGSGALGTRLAQFNFQFIKEKAYSECNSKMEPGSTKQAAELSNFGYMILALESKRIQE